MPGIGSKEMSLIYARAKNTAKYYKDNNIDFTPEQEKVFLAQIEIDSGLSPAKAKRVIENLVILKKLVRANSKVEQKKEVEEINTKDIDDIMRATPQPSQE